MEQNNEQIIISLAKITDLENIIQIENQCFDQQIAEPREVLKIKLNNQSQDLFGINTFFMVNKNNIAIGYGYLSYLNPRIMLNYHYNHVCSIIGDINQEVALINSVAILPEFRNRILGLKLIKLLIDQALTDQIFDIFAFSMEKGRSDVLLKRLKFKYLLTIPNFYPENTSAFLYYKNFRT